MVQELLGVFVLGGDIENQLRIDHDCPKHQDPWILLDVAIAIGQDQSLHPVFLPELQELTHLGLLN